MSRAIDVPGMFSLLARTENMAAVEEMHDAIRGISDMSPVNILTCLFSFKFGKRVRSFESERT